MKNKPVLLALFLCVLLACSIYFNVAQFVRSAADRSSIAALREMTGNGEAKIITKYIYDSIEHVVIREVKVKTNAGKNVAVGSGYLDTLKKALKVASNRIDAVTKTNARLQAENLILKKSSLGDRLEYNDKWLDLSYQPDSNKLDINYSVTLNTVRYWKRNWLLAPKKYFVDLSSDDARVKINSVKRFTLSEQVPKRLGIGFNAGYCYIPSLNRWAPFIGLGLNYNLIEF